MNQTTLAWKITAFVAKCYNVRTAKLFTKSRNQKYSGIRQQCMWLLHSIVNAPVSKLARFFRRSKSTVSASIGKIQDLMACDSLPAAFRFKRRFLALLCATLRAYLRLIAVKIPKLPKKVRRLRTEKWGIC